MNKKILIYLFLVLIFLCVHIKVEKDVEFIPKNDIILYHPDFPEPLKRDFYCIKNVSQIGVKIDNKKVIINFESQKRDNIFYCNAQKWSRPAICGNLLLKNTKYEIYLSKDFKIYEFALKEYIIFNANIFINEKNTKDELTVNYNFSG